MVRKRDLSTGARSRTELIFSSATYFTGAIVLALVIIGMASGAMALSLTLSALQD